MLSWLQGLLVVYTMDIANSRCTDGGRTLQGALAVLIVIIRHGCPSSMCEVVQFIDIRGHVSWSLCSCRGIAGGPYVPKVLGGAGYHHARETVDCAYIATYLHSNVPTTWRRIYIIIYLRSNGSFFNN